MEPTRKDYMDGKVTHQEYYASIAKAAGISFSKSSMLPRIKEALAAGDEHLNSIPLNWWDAHDANLRMPVARVTGERNGTGASLSDVVCACKAAARVAAEEG